MDQNIQIITERIVLRPIHLEDSALIYTYRSDPSVNQYQGWIPGTIDDIRDFINIRTSPEINVSGSWFQFVIIKKDNDELIGDVGVHFVDLAGFQVELGITLNQIHHGKGFATEALTGIIDYLFDDLNKHRITVSIDPRNTKSIQLFERLGFRKEAHFKQIAFIDGEWADDLIYAMLKEEWETCR